MLAQIKSEVIVMLRAAVYTIGTVLMLASVANADVYKYTDEKGNIQYTDRPLTLPAERLSVASHSTDVVNVQERTAEDVKPAASDIAHQQTEKVKAGQAKAAEATAEDKAAACVEARKAYMNRMNAQRIYETQPNGERRYLSSEELDSARASAKQLMDTMCN
jgi:hypothetical protein